MTFQIYTYPTTYTFICLRNRTQHCVFDKQKQKPSKLLTLDGNHNNISVHMYLNGFGDVTDSRFTEIYKSH